MTEEPENPGVIRNEKEQFVPGVSGDPAGKQPGTVSIVAKIKQKFEENPAYFDEWLDKLLEDPRNRTASRSGRSTTPPKARRSLDGVVLSVSVRLGRDALHRTLSLDPVGGWHRCHNPYPRATHYVTGRQGRRAAAIEKKLAAEETVWELRSRDKLTIAISCRKNLRRPLKLFPEFQIFSASPRRSGCHQGPAT